MREHGRAGENSGEWPRRTEAVFAPYDPTPTGRGPQDNPPADQPAELLGARSVEQPYVAPSPSAPPRRALTRRWVLVGAAAAALVAGGAALGPRRRDGEREIAIPDTTTALAVNATSSDITLRGTPGPAGAAVRWRRTREAPFAATTAGTVTSLDLAWPVSEVVINLPADLVLTVAAGTGDVDGTDLVTRQGSIDAGSGDIDLAFAEPPLLLSVTTTTGDIRLRLPPADYRFAASSDTGDVDVPAGDGPHVVRLTSGAGDIRVSVG